MSNLPAIQERHEFAQLEREVRVAAHSSLLPKAYRVERRNGQDVPRHPDQIAADVMVVALDCRARGIPFSLTTLSKYALINGVAFPMAQLLVGIADRHGYDLDIVERSATKAKVVLTRRRDGHQWPSEYTIEEAQKTISYKRDVALGPEKSVWLSHPEDKLIWRATHRAIRIGAPGVQAGFAEPDELGEHDASADYELPAPQPTTGPSPATDEQRAALAEAIGRLTKDERDELVRRWNAAGLPILRSPEFDTANAFDAALLVGGVKGFTAEPDRGGEQSPLTTSPGGKSPAEGRQPLAPSGTSVGAATPDAPTSDDRALPLGAQLKALAPAGVDYHDLIEAMTDGRTRSSSDLRPAEARRAIEEMRALAAGMVVLEKRDGRWQLFDPEPQYAPGDPGRPFTED